ncbi:DUF4168 domain-containing protein [Rhodopila sp.]|uniref:DUF4168 domain-containing protein n=1 Tax=Rhodopila sp. TaxID=2480087 RepID=UPI003D132E18
MRHFLIAASVALGLAPALAIAAPDQMSPAQPAAPSAPGTAPGIAPGASIPDGTIGKAGAALRDVAKLQEKYQGQMEQATPDQKKGLSEQANAEAVQAIQSHGLSVQEYSTVVRTAQNNPQVKQRLLAAANNAQ